MVKLKNKDNQTTFIKINNFTYNLDFGNRTKGSILSEDLIVEEVVLRTEVTCGCTSATLEGGSIVINYNSNRIGTIRQVVTLHTEKGKIKINVLGTVS